MSAAPPLFGARLTPLKFFFQLLKPSLYLFAYGSHLLCSEAYFNRTEILTHHSNELFIANLSANFGELLYARL